MARDRLEFSTRSRRLQSQDDSQNARAERIGRLREAVLGGTYNVRAKALAEVLISGALFDEKA